MIVLAMMTTAKNSHASRSENSGNDRQLANSVSLDCGTPFVERSNKVPLLEEVIAC